MEKTLKDLEGKVGENEKKELEEGVKALRGLLAGTDVEAIKAETTKLRDKSFEVFGKIYQQDPNAAAGAAGAGAAGAGFDGAQGAQTQSADDGVVDADYEVVDDDKK